MARVPGKARLVLVRLRALEGLAQRFAGGQGFIIRGLLEDDGPNALNRHGEIKAGGG